MLFCRTREYMDTEASFKWQQGYELAGTQKRRPSSQRMGMFLSPGLSHLLIKHFLFQSNMRILVTCGTCDVIM